MKKHNILTVLIDETMQSGGSYWLENNCSLVEIKTLLKIFTRNSNITGDDLWDIYNSENRSYVTNIPLVNEFIKDCRSESEIESLIKNLI
jgi:hypothetical protein